jgi:hypothetical protein
VHVRAAEQIEASECRRPQKAVIGEDELRISGLAGNLNVERSAFRVWRVYGSLQVALDAHARAFHPKILHFSSKDMGNNWIYMNVIVAIDPARRISLVAIAEPPFVDILTVQGLHKPKGKNYDSYLI